MALEVSDKMSNLHDQIANTARVIGRSTDRKKVFETIYRGKKKIKTKKEIASATGLKAMRVLQEANKLAANDIIKKCKIKKETAYEKIPFFTDHKKEILRLVTDKKKLTKYATKVQPQYAIIIKNVRSNEYRRPFSVSYISVDDIDNFAKVKKVQGGHKYRPIDESKFKQGVKEIIGESGKFQDWGGEKNDLYTTRISFKRNRILTAFAFKGKGTKGILKPNMLGKNGDQILRLFDSHADLYILQYWAQVDQSIYEMMHRMAVHKSTTTKKHVIYCIIDGVDTKRILKAYARYFK